MHHAMCQLSTANTFLPHGNPRRVIARGPSRASPNGDHETEHKLNPSAQIGTATIIALTIADRTQIHPKGITGRRLRLYNAQEHRMSLELTLNVSKRTFAPLKGRGAAPTDILHDAAMRCPFTNDVTDVRCADHCVSRSCSGIQPRAARTNSSVTGKTKTLGFTRRSSSSCHIQTTPQTRLPNESTHN